MIDETLTIKEDAGSNSNDSRGTGKSNTGSSGDVSAGSSGEQRRAASKVDGIGNGSGTDAGTDDDDDLPIGPASYGQSTLRIERPTRGAGNGRGRGSRGRKHSDTSNSDTGSSSIADSGTEKAAQQVSDPAPRPVKITELGGKPTAKDGKLTRQFIAEGYVLLFDIAGFITHDKETWEIERDGDAADLAERTHVWLQSLDRSKAAKWDKVVAKWQPFLMLLMGLIAVVGPRIAQTQQKRKQRALTTPQAGSTATGTGSPATPGSANASQATSELASRQGTSGFNGESGKSERPFSRADRIELFGQTNIPTM